MTQVRTGTASSGEVDIHYEDMGDPADPAVLLIMGLGAQMIFWRTEFCQKLIDRGLRVIRFDNRDVGLSGKLPDHHSGAPLLPRMARGGKLFWRSFGTTVHSPVLAQLRPTSVITHDRVGWYLSQWVAEVPRIDAGGACAGSVGPRTRARKSAHESSAGSHSTE